FSSRRRHTRFSRDWSSDVCSSDLKIQRSNQHLHSSFLNFWRWNVFQNHIKQRLDVIRLVFPIVAHPVMLCRTINSWEIKLPFFEIGRASCRERWWISVWAVVYDDE